MRVLWFTNIPIGEAPELLGAKKSFMGGWLHSLFAQLAAIKGVDLSVAFPSRPGGVKYGGEMGCYYTFMPGPMGVEPLPAVVDQLRTIIKRAAPNLVHLFGTEGQHAVAVMRLCEELQVPVVLQMQGLAGSIANHYYGWLPDRVTRRVTPLEFMRRHRSMRSSQASFEAAGTLERESLLRANHVLGCTTYDRAWLSQIDPEAKYHHVDEILRDPFYTTRTWVPQSIERHSLLVSQATLPYKGVHIAISALPIVLQQFPEAHLYIAGPDPVGNEQIWSHIRRSGYGWHLRKLISKHGLSRNVTFLGPLDESAMRDRFLISHAFLSRSSAENQSNSVSEAKMLGVPVVASYVGGVVDRIEHGSTGYLYQGDSTSMLAHFVMQVFSDDELAARLGSAARADAQLRHNPQRIVSRVLEVYEDVLSEDGG